MTGDRSAAAPQAIRDWKSGKSGKPLLETVKTALDEAKAESKAKHQGEAGLLTEIAISRDV